MNGKGRKSVKEEERGREDTTNKSVLSAECGTYIQSSVVPHPLRVEMNKIGEGVLESRFQFLPPSENKAWGTDIHIMHQEDDQTLARLEIDHILGRYDQVKLKCSSTSEDDHSLNSTNPDPDANITLTPQDVIQLHVGCNVVYKERGRSYAYPLSFSRFMWEKIPRALQRLVSVLPYINTLVRSIVNHYQINIIRMGIILRVTFQEEECWMELSVNPDEENQKLLKHKCPFKLPKFPQLHMAVECPHDAEQCGTINFCNTGQSTLPTYSIFIFLHVIDTQRG